MFGHNRAVPVLAAMLLSICLPVATSAQVGGPPPAPSAGSTASPALIAGWNLDVEPNGAGLPQGSGTPAAGASLFAAQCSSCHGADGQGMAVAGHGAFPRLVGGFGTLTSDTPIKTVGSFWPYATVLFDYIRRAMPFTAPQSLSNDQVYAVTAFILAKNGIIANTAAMDAQTLPKVRMPNRDGFYTRPPPETDNSAPHSLFRPTALPAHTSSQRNP